METTESKGSSSRAAQPQSGDVAIVVERSPHLKAGEKEDLREEAAELLEDLNAFYSRSPAITERALELTASTLNRRKSFALSHSRLSNTSAPDSSREDVHTRSVEPDHGGENGAPSQPLLADHRRSELLGLAARYETLLQSLGHEKEAQRVAEFLQGVKEVSAANGVAPGGGAQDDADLLTGMEALLKDGLVRFLMTVKPFLPPFPSQIVKFTDVNYSTLLPIDDTPYDDMLTKFVPCLRKKVPMERVPVLSGVTGYLMPGSLTLCLGPLASGQTALTKILGGRSWVDKKTWHQSGRVTYNGKDLQEVQISRLASYAGPYPNHHPALTVRETLEFARGCSQVFRPWHSEDLQEALGLPKGSKARDDAKTDLIIKVLGLKPVEHVPVGALTPDELRRLSIAEMRAGTYTVHLHDDVGVDFDPALAFDIVSMLKATSRVFQTVQWVACDNLSSEVYNQFDRVVVLNGGRIVYQGPRLDALLYFERLGYFKPQHVEVADYLMEVTTADGHQYLRPGAQALDVDGFVAEYEGSELYQDVRRVAESGESTHVYWMKLTDPSQVAFENAEVLTDGGKTSKTLPAISWLDEALVSECSLDRTSEPHLGDVVSGFRVGNGMFRFLAVGDHDSSAAGLMVALKGAEGDVWLQLERPLSEVDGVLPRQWEQKYVQPFWPSTRRVLHRQWLVTIRNKTAIKARLIQVIILGIFAGTLLYQKSLRPPTTVLLGLRKAAPFIAILVIFLGALAQVPGQMVERAIYYKHHAQGFYRASSYVLAAFVCNAPLVAMEVLVYGCLLYFLTGGSLYDHWAPIFVFLVLLYMSGTIGASMVRMLTSCLESAAAVNQIAGILIGLFIVFAGFLIPLHIMPKWWFWFYYLSPMQWIITGLMINEFRSGRYDQICGDYPPALLAVLPYCRGANLDKSVGEAYLDFYSIQYRKWWLGICFAVLVVFVLGLQLLAWLGLKYVSFPEKLNQRISLAGFLQTRRFGKRAEVPQPTEWQTVQPPKANGSEHAGDTAEALVVKAAALPAFQPVTLSWHDVSSEVPIPNFKDPRVVLSHVSGWAKPGTMTAIMGVKGSGKTVLMDILAGRNTPGRTKGSILVNGYPRDVDTFRRVRGHVSPSDVHPACATVRECVQFSAKLRLPRDTTPETREALVSEVLTLTGLSASAAHLVGTPGINGLDPEQLRRLSLAVELVTNPAVIFVNEPDKNLDPQAARRIVACNHAVARSGRTVISTLNHPVGRILGVFDRLLLLKRGGETTYWGPVGGLACVEAVGYFERIPGTLPCGFSENPADYLIECIGGGLRQRTDRDYSFDYRHSGLAAESAAELRVLRRSKGQAGPNLVEKGYAAPMSTIYKEVLLRAQRTYFRNLSYSFGRVTSAILLGLIFGSVFWQMPYTTIVRSGARGGVIYISTLLMTIGSATAVILELNKERPVYDRERSHRMYPALAWSLSWGLAEIPYIAVSFLFHCAILCSMTNIATDSAASFFEFWFTLCLFGATIVYAAMFLAVATPAPQIAIVIINVFINLMIASAGYVIPKAQFPKFWRFAYWINPAQYTLNSLRSIAFYCDTKSPQCTIPGCAINPVVCPACTCPRLKDNNNVFVWTSQQSSAQLDNGRRLWDWMALLAFCVFFRVLAYLALRRAKFNNKY